VGRFADGAGLTSLITSPYETGQLKRYVGLAGLQFRPTQKLTLTPTTNNPTA